LDTGSREENASRQESRASVLIQSEPMLWKHFFETILLRQTDRWDGDSNTRSPHAALIFAGAPESIAKEARFNPPAC
jgi:hypothetical protein